MSAGLIQTGPSGDVPRRPGRQPGRRISFANQSPRRHHLFVVRRRPKPIRLLPDVETVGSLRGQDARETARALLPTALYHPDPDTRREAIYVLGTQFRSVRQVKPVLCQIVADPRRTPQERGFAADSLAKVGFVGRSATTALLKALRDDDVEARFWAAFALGQAGDLRSIEPLKVATDDKAVLEDWHSVGKEALDVLSTDVGDTPEGPPMR